MISEDIVKKIKFVFSGENKELKRTLSETDKMAQSLSKSFDLNKQSKVLDQFVKNLGNTNKELTKSMQGLQKGFKDLAEKDFDKFTKKVQGAYKAMMDVQNKISQAEKNGDSQEAARLGRIRDQINKNMVRNAQAANNTGHVPGGPGGGGMGNWANNAWSMMNGGMGIAMGFGALRSVPNLAAGAGRFDIENRANLATIQKRHINEFMQGDFSRQLVMNELGSDGLTGTGRVQNAIKEGTASRVLSLDTLSGGAKNLWTETINNPGKTALGLLSAPYGMYRAGKAFFGGASKAYDTKTAQDTESLSQQTIDSSRAKMLFDIARNNAQSRYALQSSMYMDDSSLATNLRQLRGSKMTEAEATQFAMMNKGVMGNNWTTANFAGAGNIHQATGMSLSSSNSLMQMAGMNASRNTSSQQAVIDMFSEAFKRGIQDSSLAENISQGVGQIAQSLSSRVDMASMSGRIASAASLMGGDGRAVQGAISAMNQINSDFKAGDERQYYHESQVRGITSGIRNRNTADRLQTFLRGKSQSEIQTLATSSEFQADLTNMGLSSEEVSSFKSGLSGYGKGYGNMTATGRSVQRQIDQLVRQGVDRQEAVRLVMKYGGGAQLGGTGTDEAIGAYGAMKLGYNFDPNLSGPSPLANGSTGSDVLTNVGKDNELKMNMESLTDPVMSANNLGQMAQANRTANQTAGSLGALGQPIQKVIDSLGLLQQALSTGSSYTDFNQKVNGK